MLSLRDARHRYSGWPGAWCLDCGTPDLREQALADDAWEIVFEDPNSPDPTGIKWLDHDKEMWIETVLQICPEPGSNRFNPYSLRPPLEMPVPLERIAICESPFMRCLNLATEFSYGLSLCQPCSDALNGPLVRF